MKKIKCVWGQVLLIEVLSVLLICYLFALNNVKFLSSTDGNS